MPYFWVKFLKNLQIAIESCRLFNRICIPMTISRKVMYSLEIMGELGLGPVTLGLQALTSSQNQKKENTVGFERE